MKYRLEQLSGAQAGRKATVGRSEIVIGRAPECDFAFDPQRDIYASGRHATIRQENGKLVLHDLGSSYGTFLNGVMIEREDLQDGDVIEFGLDGPRLRVRLATS